MAPEVVRSEALMDKGVLLGEIIDRRTMTDVGEKVVHAKMCSQAGVLPGWYWERTSLLHSLLGIGKWCGEREHCEQEGETRILIPNPI